MFGGSLFIFAELSGEIKRVHVKTRTRLESDPAPYDPEVFPSSNQPPPLEESFSIFLGVCAAICKSVYCTYR